VTALIPSPGPQDLDGLRTQLREREAALDARQTEVARIRAALDAFRIRYRRQVGLLHEQLDDLEAALAEAELGILSERVASGDRSNEPAIGLVVDPAPRALTSDAVRKLFRDVAKAIHPDRAEDDATRDRRHSLMIEANRAYALGDEAQLRAILEAWERSPEAVQGTDSSAIRLRLERRIRQIDEELQALDRDLEAMRETSIWKLKAMADAEAARGNDLISDMVRRLRRDILVASNRLEALRHA